jgi:hypothetical protein|tara:strand:- start:13275 stop:13445 length:171 start_codon:yes stop_codon:yes gene_type:complete
MFLKVVDTIVTQEIEPKQVKEDDAKTTDRELLSQVEQSEYDVLYGDSLQRPTGERK